MAKATIRLGTRLPALLAARGVDTVFGIPGVHTVEMYRGLPGSGIRHVTPRHEQGAGFMADGFARVSGRPGVCFIITGPGMTNIVTAMGQAYADSIPMLVISSVNQRAALGSGEGWLHEMPNQSALVAGVAAFSRTIRDPAELEPALDDAFAVFAGARPRPVHLEIPIDVLQMPVAAGPVAAPRTVVAPAPTPAAIAEAATILANAVRPVILAGGGARRADVAALAERLDAPVAMTTNARGLLPPGHPLGVSLSASFPETRAMVAAADVVLAIGTELGPTDYDFWEDGGFTVAGRLLRIDVAADQIDRNRRADLGIVADAAKAVAALLAVLPTRATGDGAARAAAAMAGIAALPDLVRADLRLLDLVRDTLPNAPIVGDSTQIVYSGITGFSAGRPGGFFNSATGFGTLGYGLPAAIGASLAENGPVVAISGDGGIQFCLGEFASAREAEVPVILILHDNAGYGEIKGYMQARGIAPIGVDIFTPDLGAVAAACGWTVVAPHVGEMRDALLAAAGRTGPTMIYLPEAVRRSF